MYLKARGLRIEFQRVILRKEQEVREWVSKNLDRTEQYTVLRDPNHLGLRVAIMSIRAKELLVNLHRDVFSPGFEKPKPWLQENGVWSAWFGYSEPWSPSVHYVHLG
jgi:hypothetical protein